MRKAALALIWVLVCAIPASIALPHTAHAQTSPAPPGGPGGGGAPGGGGGAPGGGSPPPSGGGSSGGSSSSSSDSGGHRGKITGESIMLWQGISIGCSAVSTMVHSGIVAGAQRELTPLEAVDDSARCTFIPAMIVSAISHLSGMNDNACTLKVARDAFKENNSPRAREELFWRDGSWERRQQKFLARYYDCYHEKRIVHRVQRTHRRRH